MSSSEEPIPVLSEDFKPALPSKEELEIYEDNIDRILEGHHVQHYIDSEKYMTSRVEEGTPSDQLTIDQKYCIAKEILNQNLIHSGQVERNVYQSAAHLYNELENLHNMDNQFRPGNRDIQINEDWNIGIETGKEHQPEKAETFHAGTPPGYEIEMAVGTVDVGDEDGIVYGTDHNAELWTDPDARETDVQYNEKMITKAFRYLQEEM